MSRQSASRNGAPGREVGRGIWLLPTGCTVYTVSHQVVVTVWSTYADYMREAHRRDDDGFFPSRLGTVFRDVDKHVQIQRACSSTTTMSEAGSSSKLLVFCLCSIAQVCTDVLPYDPDQDAEEKRAVRKKYRSLQKTMEGEYNRIRDNSTQNASFSTPTKYK